MIVLLLDIVGSITHQAVQANYHTAITHGIQYVCTAWCVIGPTITKNKHSMLKLISRLEGECGIATGIGRDALHQIFTCFRSLKGLIDKENDQCIYNLQTLFLASADITTIALQYHTPQLYLMFQHKQRRLNIQYKKKNFDQLWNELNKIHVNLC